MTDFQVHPLSFDLSQPYGPCPGIADWAVTLTPKSIEFDYKRSAGYDCDASLTFVRNNNKQTANVFALRLSNLVYEYGWNAVRMHFDQGGEACASIDSQHFASDAQCVVTCIIQATHVDLYVESGPNVDPLPRLDEESKPILMDEKGVLYYHRIDLNPELSLPNVKLAIMYRNKVEIVSPWDTRGYVYHSESVGHCPATVLYA